ncbi:MAG: hypothetical protein ACKON9_28940, partial [Planctomycetaceae bacterium]
LVLVLSPPWRTVLVLVLEKHHSPPPFAPSFAASRLRVKQTVRTPNAKAQNSGWKARATENRTPADSRPWLA